MVITYPVNFRNLHFYMNAARVISILANQVFRNLKERDSFHRSYQLSVIGYQLSWLIYAR
jgi:hypothetical protein